MLIRLPLAFLTGLAIYMVAMLMTVYDGILSLLFQPIMGSILTVIAMLVLCVIGSPLLVGRLWKKWRELWWISVAIAGAGFVCLVLSWMPGIRVKVWDPEMSAWIDSFEPTLSIGGWLAMIFGVAFCPVIGFRGDRRWV
jgi:hypothetical protein